MTKMVPGRMERKLRFSLFLQIVFSCKKEVDSLPLAPKRLVSDHLPRSLTIAIVRPLAHVVLLEHDVDHDRWGQQHVL